MKNPVTTVTGTLLIILSLFTLYGVTTAVETAALSDYITIIGEAVAGIIAVFIAKDKGGGV